MYTKRILYFKDYTQRYDSKVQRIENRGERGRSENPRRLARERLVDGLKILALYPSTPEPIPRGNSRERPHGNFRFPWSGRLYGSFRGSPPIRKFSYVPFTRRVRRVSPSRSLALRPRFLVRPVLSLSFYLEGPPTHAGTSKHSFAARDTRVNIHAPTVVAFRCIFTPESSLPRCIFIRREWYVTSLPPIKRKGEGAERYCTAIDATREKKDRSIEVDAVSMWRDVCEVKRIRGILLKRGSTFRFSVAETQWGNGENDKKRIEINF